MIIIDMFPGNNMIKKLLLAGVCCLNLSPAFADTMLSWSELSQKAKSELKSENIDRKVFNEIIAGKIITQQRAVPAGKTGVHVAAFGIVNATSELTYNVIEDCPKLSEFMPHFTSCKEVKPDINLPSNEKWMENTLTFGFSVVKLNISVVQHVTYKPPFKLTWDRVKGDMKLNEGYYRIIPLNKNKQILVYDILSDAGRAVPDFIQSMLTEKDLPNVVNALQKRAEEKYAKN
jgi:hypothetical protein